MTDLSLFPVIILAGGLATRLLPLTEKIPKSLIKINQQPFIYHQLNLLAEFGIKNVILCVGHLGEQIQDYVADGKKFGLSVKYSFDGEILLGTAGSIKKSLPLLANDDFFVLYGDSYLLCDFFDVQKSFIQQKKLALMTVFHNQNKLDKSNVIFKKNKILTYDKKNQVLNMDYIDYGLGVFNKNSFAGLSNGYADLADLYQKLLADNQLAGYEVSQRFYEVGSLTGIAELEGIL